MDIKENTKKKIVLKKYPFIEWGVALAFLVAFIFSEGMIWICNKEVGKYFLHHTKTQVLLLSILLLISLLCIYEGEVETVTFDKAGNNLQVRYTNFMCIRRVHCQPLHEITSIRACKRGRSGPSETCHYVLCIYMKSG